jgi:hypothetical protein
MTRHRATIIYIAGYGRSGSTLLAIVLGSHHQVTSLGEVNYLLEDWTLPNRRCSCGQPFNECEFWRGLFPKAPPSPELTALIQRLESLLFLAHLVLGIIPDRGKETYADFQRRLFSQVASYNGTILAVDSSKSAHAAVGRPWALKRVAGLDVYMLPLVRNGYACMESIMVTGSNWAMEGRPGAKKKKTVVRSTLGWLSANLWPSILGRSLGPERYLRLRFEDFLAEPESSLEKIGRFCGFDPREIIERIKRDDSFPVGHMTGGNRIRLEEKIRLTQGRPQCRGERLRQRDRRLFTLLGGWLNRFYGYPW